jgi:hypothetical protein
MLNNVFQFNEKRVILQTLSSAWERGSMIVLLVASAINLTGLQASINAPRDAFKVCLREASSKASNDKVAADGFDAYVRQACTAQLDEFKGAIVKFDMSNKMSKKASGEDADAMIADFVSSALDHYQYVTGGNGATKQAAAAPAPAATVATPPPPTPAVATEPPK